MTIIPIGRAFYDDFKHHPGWWPVFDNPELEVGDEIFFEFDWPSESRTLKWDGQRALVTGIKTNDSRKYGWWIIEYVLIES